MGFYYFDYTYLLFLAPAIIITMIAQIGVKTTFNQYSKVLNMKGLTGAASAQRVLEHGGSLLTQVQMTGGHLTDHFDPKTNIIRLSQSVYGSATVSAVGVAAHEAGHAVQYATGYGPIKFRTAIYPIVSIGSNLSMPLILIGLLLPVQYNFVVYIGIGLYSLSVLFSLVTLPVEFNASSRALRYLEETNSLTADELIGAKKVLRAAAMTYVASTFVALLSLLRLILIFGNRRGRES
mgnify:FL=1